MAHESIPNSLDVPMTDLAALAVEWWRLRSALAESASGASRHALRKIEDFLKARQIEAQSLEGTRYDPGMAVKVLDVIDDPKLKRGESLIEQTVSPLVFWQGQVIRPAEVVTRRGKN